jgi:Flagellar hook capping protein
MELLSIAPPASKPRDVMADYDGSLTGLAERREAINADLRSRGIKPTEIDYEALEKNAQKFAHLSNDITQMNFEQWLKVTIESFRNQDPMNPKDPGEVATQFANIGMAIGFSEARKDMSQIIGLMTKGMSLNASDKAGKEVEVEFNKFRYNGEADVELGYDLPVSAKKVHISIFDEKNQLVRSHTIEEDKKKGILLKLGRNTFNWEGDLRNGVKAEPGVYQFQVRAYDIDDSLIKDPNTGKGLQLRKYVRGTLDASYVSNDKPMVVVDGIDMPFDAIKKVMNKAETPLLEAATQGLTPASSPASSVPQAPLSAEAIANLPPEARRAYNIQRMEQMMQTLNPRQMNSIIERNNLG